MSKFSVDLSGQTQVGAVVTANAIRAAGAATTFTAPSVPLPQGASFVQGVFGGAGLYEPISDPTNAGWNATATLTDPNDDVTTLGTWPVDSERAPKSTWSPQMILPSNLDGSGPSTATDLSGYELGLSVTSVLPYWIVTGTVDLNTAFPALSGTSFTMTFGGGGGTNATASFTTEATAAEVAATINAASVTGLVTGPFSAVIGTASIDAGGHLVLTGFPVPTQPLAATLSVTAGSPDAWVALGFPGVIPVDLVQAYQLPGTVACSTVTGGARLAVSLLAPALGG
jgi:hypothetical protein